MGYAVIRPFADLNDRSDVFPNGYLYKVGDTYPREGVEVDSARLNSLASTDNLVGEVFLKQEVEQEEQVKSKRSGRAAKKAGDKNGA